MATTTVENLEFHIVNKNDGAVETFDKLTDAMKRCQAVMHKFPFNDLIKGINAISTAAKRASGDVTKAFGQMSDVSNKLDMSGVTKAFESVNQATAAVNDQLSEIQKRLDDLSSKSVNLGVTTGGASGSGNSNVIALLSRFGKIGSVVAKWSVPLMAVFKVLQGIVKLAGAAAKLVAKVVRLGANLTKNLGRGVLSGARGLTSFLLNQSTIKKLSETIGKLFENVTKFFSIAGLFRLFNSAIKKVTESMKEGTENAYWFSRQFGQATRYISEAYDSLSSGSFKMSNQLGAAWSSLIAAIQPILLQLINLVTRAAEAVTQLFAVLGGKSTYLKAVNFNKQWAESADDAAEAAKEWKNQLMDFDTLNRLNDSGSSSGGKNSKIPDYGNMFEETPIESWLENLKKLSFPDIGGKIADWLNGILKKIDNWFISSRPKWAAYAKNLADLLNGFIDKFDWSLLGKTVGDGLNAVFDAINTFLTNVKWFELGRGVGTAIKSLFDTVEWDLIGQTFANKWNALMHFIEGVVTTPGIWQSIGTAIGKFVRSWIDTIDVNSLARSGIAIINGVSSMIGAFLDQDPFKNLAPKLTNAINLFINGVQWAELGSKIGQLFQYSLNTLFQIVQNFPFEKLGRSIAVLLDNMAAQVDFGQLGHLLMSIGLGLWKTLYGAVEYLVESGGIGRLAKNLSNFVTGALNELAAWLESLDTKVISGALGQFFGSIDYKGIKDAFMRVLKAAVQLIDIKEIFRSFREASKKEMENSGEESGNGFGSGIKSAFAMIANTAIPSYAKPIAAALKIYESVFKSGGEYSMAGFLQGLSNKFADIKTFFSGMLSVFSTVGSGLVSALQSGFNSLWGSFSSGVSSLVSTLVSGIKTTVQTGFSGLSTAIGSAVTTASGKLNELASAARTSISTLLENSKTSLNSIVSGIQGAINGIISKANSILAGLRGRSYATGGFPEDGIFFANHSELVGQFSNGKTAVANNEQIVSGIKQGVYQAVREALGGQSNGNDGQPLNVYIGDELVYSGFAKYSKRQQLISGGRA